MNSSTSTSWNHPGIPEVTNVRKIRDSGFFGAESLMKEIKQESYRSVQLVSSSSRIDNHG